MNTFYVNYCTELLLLDKISWVKKKLYHLFDFRHLVQNKCIQTRGKKKNWPLMYNKRVNSLRSI